MKGGFCNMKTVPIDASLRKIVSVQRNNLQRKSLLKNSKINFNMRENFYKKKDVYIV